MDYKELEARLIAIRRQLHQYPELSLEEYETTSLIKKWLRAEGIEPLQTSLSTGVFAEIHGKGKTPVVGIRADIDALPIEEETGLPFSSKVKGKMHACGHDFHTAAVIGAAYLLQKNKEKLKGSVKLIFQPAEEIGGGARLVIRDGQLQNMDYLIGLHNKPDLRVGMLGINKGAMMAAVDRFKVEVVGKGGHAGAPQLGRDPIITSTQIVSALQSIVSRNVSPLQSVVLSVTKIEAGNTWNVIPEKAIFEGTIRTFDEQVRRGVKNRFEQIVYQMSGAFEQESTVQWFSGPPALMNHEEVANSIIETAKKQSLEVVASEPSMGGEDFSEYLNHVKGAFVFFGTNGKEDWHHPKFTVDESALIHAATFLYESAKDLLTLQRS